MVNVKSILPIIPPTPPIPPKPLHRRLMQTPPNTPPNRLDNLSSRQQSWKDNNHLLLALNHHNKVIPHLEPPKRLVDQHVPYFLGGNKPCRRRFSSSPAPRPAYSPQQVAGGSRRLNSQAAEDEEAFCYMEGDR